MSTRKEVAYVDITFEHVASPSNQKVRLQVVAIPVLTREDVEQEQLFVETVSWVQPDRRPAPSTLGAYAKVRIADLLKQHVGEGGRVTAVNDVPCEDISIDQVVSEMSAAVGAGDFHQLGTMRLHQKLLGTLSADAIAPVW